MLLRDIWEVFRKDVFTVPSTEVLFNQYRDRVEGLDLPGAEEIRRENLRGYLASFGRRPRALVVGEAPGPWGCRFSGLPFTGERMLEEGAFPFGGRKSSTHEPPYQERSGVIFWRDMLPRLGEFLLVNSVPFHPHRRGEPLSIRTPTRGELEGCAPILAAIVERLDPRTLVAVGRKAEAALGMLGLPALYVRHPSRGGAREFARGMERIFGGRGLPSG
ncbi:MAG: uracil-DNA glycosylase [Nitrospirota bacterium]|jgi:hypothetical protein